MSKFIEWKELDSKRMRIDYTNWKGVRRIRRIEILPGSLYFGSTEYHPQAQFLFKAYDLEESNPNTLKDFAMSGVHNVMGVC